MSKEAGRTLRPGWTIYVLPALVYSLAAFYFGSVHADPIDLAHFDFEDKIMHALVFGGMHWTHARAAGFLWPVMRTPLLAAWAFFTTALAGGALELWQFLLPHRSADWADFAADCVGAGIAAAVFLLARRRKSRAMADEA